jgi:cell wall-associated NlpC family hydrolase
MRDVRRIRLQSSGGARCAQTILRAVLVCTASLAMACDRRQLTPGPAPPETNPTVSATAVPTVTAGPTALAPLATLTAASALTATPQPTVMPSPTELVPVASPTAQGARLTLVPSPKPSATALSMRDRIVSRARYYANQPTQYRAGASGPVEFDCTGLVYRVFADCSAEELVGAHGEEPVRGYYDWFNARGLADTATPGLGDLVIYGPDWTHVAIYIGDGRAISTLMAGVREHSATSLRNTNGERMPVVAYLHIQAQ